MIELNVQERWFLAIEAGRKVFEGRKYNPEKSFPIGEKIKINNANNKNQYIIKTIVGTKVYNNFEAMIRDCRLKNILPGETRIKAGVAIYAAFYKEDIHKAAIAIELE